MTSSGHQGVGFKREPPVFLQDGDSVTVEIDGIGKLTNSIVYEKK
jgi:acylpyruvate hydrolase